MAQGRHRRGRGEGSIYRRSSDGRWVGSLVVPETGKRKSVTGNTRQEVQRKLGVLRQDIEQGLSVGDGRQTVGQYLVNWLETVKPTREESTWVTHESYVRVHFIPLLGRLPLVKLTPQRIQTFYAQLLSEGLSGTTVNHMHGSLHKALDAAVRLGLVARNAAELVDVPRMEPHEIRPLTRAQARAFLASARGERLEALFVLALATGMRQGELLALHWGDVDLEKLDGGTLSVRWSLRYYHKTFTVKEPKTRRSRRRIALAEQTVEALRAHRARQLQERLKVGKAWVGAAWDDLVFCNEIGAPLTSNGQVRSTRRRILRHAGLPETFRFHDLRHTCATLALASNVNPKVVSEMLGHSTVAVTLDIYSHVLPDMQEDAAAAIAAILYG